MDFRGKFFNIILENDALKVHAFVLFGQFRLLFFQSVGIVDAIASFLQPWPYILENGLVTYRTAALGISDYYICQERLVPILDYFLSLPIQIPGLVRISAGAQNYK